jgi:hypothetical protein
MEGSHYAQTGQALRALALIPSLGLARRLGARRERRAVRAARWRADTEIMLTTSPPLRVAWRVEELVTTKSRLDLAHAVRSLVRHSSARFLPAASPVNRGAVRGESARFLAIADRLADLDRPVAARGIVLLQRLLDDLGGPLYDRDRVDELGTSLDAVLDALEPR